MKNIHVLSTDKPSKLLKDLVDETYQFKKEVSYGNRFELPLNIYITSDEEIKVGDWFYNSFLNKISKMDVLDYSNFRQKIILTTDQDLIEEGVQAIDDEFLEWFVKNPSCEEVEVEESNLLNTSRTYLGVDKYKIIIPKEEPKQETIEEVAENNYYFESDIEMVNFISEMASTGKIPNRWSAFVAKINELYLFKQEQDKKLYSEEEVIQFVDSVLFNKITRFLKNPKETLQLFKNK